MPPSPCCHVREKRYKLDGRLRQAVEAPLPVTRVIPPTEQPRGRESLQPVGKDVRSDTLLAVLQQFAIAAPIPEHHIADDDEAPAIAQLFKCEVDRAPGST